MAGLEFEWDHAKDAANFIKHGVGFALACGVFEDAFAVERIDDRHDYGEERFLVIGIVEGRLMSVAYTMRGDVIRIVSARGATPFEKRLYHEENS